MNKIVKHSIRVNIYLKYMSKAKYSSSPVSVQPAKLNFDDFVLQRQHQAMRSVVVQVSSEKSFPELYSYCTSYGNIVGAHHYCVRHDDIQHYILLEYENSKQATEAINCSAYNEEINGVPARSSFLWFRAAGKKPLKCATAENVVTPKLNVIDGSNAIDINNLNLKLRECPHIDVQITELYQRTKLNELGIRLRFLAAYQIQHAISGMFPLANALPFGSSVNGFGKMGCDLDLILRMDRECKGPDLKKISESRLVFHTKENLTNGRSQTQRQMESIADMLQLFLPGVCHVRRILQARVPIIKYHHEHLNLEVDLSMSNLSGFYMSELLYMFGEFDERVKPLVFCIRRWASVCGLTNSSPGRWISNFSLTCLVIFFLQQTKQPVLPTINSLIKSATQDDKRLTEDGINCTFARDFQVLDFRSSNTSRTSELLLQFFEFYSQFDFQNKAISLNEGRVIAKPDYSAVYIVNPLEQLLNVSKNVSLEECERLRIEVRNAAWILESEMENQHQTEENRNKEMWGLLNLFRSPERTVVRPNMFFKPRILEVSDLFEGGDLSNTQSSKSSDSASVGFKNNHVKQQVDNIKNSARQDIKKMRLNASVPGATAKAVYSSPKGSKRSR